jgi:hypothetical protein
MHLGGGNSGPRQHGVAWIPIWRLEVGLGMPGLQQCSCRGSGPSGVHGLGGAMECMWTCGRGVWTHLV